MAIFCGKKKLSPVVFESTPKCIAEEAIFATRACDVKGNPKLVGGAIGTMIRRLHMVGVIYNNPFLDHVFIKKLLPYARISTKIIDLESARFSRSQEDFQRDIDGARDELKWFYREDKNAQETALTNLNGYYYA